MAAEKWIKTGDTLPRINTTLTDGSGVPIDIAQADIAFTMRRIDDDEATILLAPASNDQVNDGLDDGSRGTAHYDWEIGDTDVAGGYYAEWQVTFAYGDSEGITTFPNDGYDLIAIVDALEAGS